MTKIGLLVRAVMVIMALHLSGFLGTAAVNVAVLPFRADVDPEIAFLKDGIRQIVSSRIGLPGKVYVLEESKVRKAVENQNAELDQETAQSIGYQLGADYLIMGEVVQEGERITIQGKILPVKREVSAVPFSKECRRKDAIIPSVSDLGADLRKIIVDLDKKDTMPFADDAPEAPVESALEEKIFPAEAARGESAEETGFGHPASLENARSRGLQEPGKISLNYWRSKKVSPALRGLAVGDADGDGNKEVVCLTGERIVAYRKKGEALRKIAEYKEDKAADFVRLDLLDTNGNGIDEVFITNREGASFSSIVLEYSNESFQKIVERGEWLFRVVRFPEEGLVLLGQARGDSAFEETPIERLQWNSGRYVSSGPAEIPAGIDLGGLGILGGKNPKKKEFVSLDNAGRLSTYDSDGIVQWKSENFYRGSAMAGQPSSEEPSATGEERALLPLRVITKDLNNDQKEDILLGKNFFEAKGLIRRKSAPEGGSIYALQWNGSAMDTRWQTERLGEALIDYAIGDADNDGKDELVVGVREGRSRLTLRSQNYIFVYEIS